MAITASIGVSRMLSFSSTATGATTANLFPKTLTAKNLASLSTPFIQSLRIKPLQHNRVRLSRNMSTSAATPVTASLAVGSKLPNATLSYFGAAGEIQTTTISDLTKSKKSVLFAVPGAFTPTCSKKHLPGFVEKSVNDVFVMKAWKENLGIGDEVMLLSDGNMEFTKAIGAELDLSDKPGKNRFTSDKKRVMLTATNKHTRGEYGRK